KLSDLVMLYAGIARLGTVLPLSERLGAPAPEARRLMGAVAAWYVSNVLIGSPPPENGTPGRIAFKTGTSYGYRDAWSIGFDGKHTIGVWVGRPDGAPGCATDRVAACAKGRAGDLERQTAAAAQTLCTGPSRWNERASLAAHFI